MNRRSGDHGKDDWSLLIRSTLLDGRVNERLRLNLQARCFEVPPVAEPNSTDPAAPRGALDRSGTPRALNGQAGPATSSGAGFVLPDDLEITLWAESPMFFNPTNIDVDARGRVWVAEAVNYRDFNTAKQDPLTHPAGDRVVILTDTDNDGRADRSKVFVQDKDLRAPLGLAVIGHRVVVSASPHLVVYTDENGDDVPDKKEILLTGFGGLDHDHGLHALVAGPDGR